MEALAPFRFNITYRPGKQGTMPDALLRRANYHPGKRSTVDQEYNFVQALPNCEDDCLMSPSQSDNVLPSLSLRTLLFDYMYRVWMTFANNRGTNN